MSQETILIADDEATVREVVQRYLELEGFRVLTAEDGESALKLLRSQTPDLLILDIMLPGVDGYGVIHAVREAASNSQLQPSADVPVIMLTARTDEDDRVRGFELGADDYVPKPFSPKELVMRVKAILRRTQSIANRDRERGQLLRFGTVLVDVAARTVMREDERIELTATEFDLLVCLAGHPKQVFSRAQLLEQVWGYSYFGDDSTVTVHVHRLREKIEQDPNKPQFIHTVWGVGYKFEEL